MLVYYGYDLFLCLYQILFIYWSWLNSLYIVTYIPLDAKQQRATSKSFGNSKRFMLLLP